MNRHKHMEAQCRQNGAQSFLRSCQSLRWSRIFPTIMKSEGSLSCLQNSYPEPCYVSKIHFNIVFLSMDKQPTRFPSLEVSRPQLYMWFSLLPIRATFPSLPIHPDFIPLIKFGEEYKLQNSSFPPFSCYFLCTVPCPQHLLSMFSLSCKIRCVTPIQNNGKNYFNIKFFR
jgi:hypothetical protein